MQDPQRSAPPAASTPLETDYQSIHYDYQRHIDQDRAEPVRHPVVVIGAGPVGLTLALDLAQQGIKVVLLDDDHRLSVGSRAICFSKRTLDIFNRLGVAEPMLEKGVSWNIGKVFFGDDLLYRFDLLPESGHAHPAFINLQQYYVEGYLADAVAHHPNIDLRWKNKLTAVHPGNQSVRLDIETPEGNYLLEADYLVACDGSRSPVRKSMGLESKGQTFRDRFLIADVKMTADFPTERWFWFDPPFHRNQSVLLHKQPDNVWRVDFQLGWDADPEVEKQPERVIPRIKALLGRDVDFTLEWVSVYTFSCLRMDSFRHGRVLFAGDAAHGVSPFGARGANSGVQDVDNLAWKLRMVLEGKAPHTLLDTYAREREQAADENIMNSTRSTDFITPKSEISKLFRNAVLDLARDQPFARRMVNSGRLSLPSTHHDSPLNTPDSAAFTSSMQPGTPALDAPFTGADKPWLLQLLGHRFTLLLFTDRNDAAKTLLNALQTQGSHDIAVITINADNTEAWQRYDALPDTIYLVRPDQHICARWRSADIGQIIAAYGRAIQAPVAVTASRPVAMEKRA